MRVVFYFDSKIFNITQNDEKLTPIAYNKIASDLLATSQLIRIA